MVDYKKLYFILLRAMSMIGDVSAGSRTSELREIYNIASVSMNVCEDIILRDDRMSDEEYEAKAGNEERKPPENKKSCPK